MGVRGLQWCSVVHVVSSSAPSEYHWSSNSPGETKARSHTQYISKTCEPTWYLISRPAYSGTNFTYHHMRLT